MLKSIKYVVFAVVGLILIVYLGRSCRLYDKVVELKGQVTTQKEVISSLKQDEAKAKAIIDGQLKAIAEKDVEIAEYKRRVDHGQDQIDAGNGRIHDLENELAGLSDSGQIIANLKNQIEAWKSQFSLAQGIIKEKDGIIFSLEGKYQAQLVITQTLGATFTKRIEEQQKLIELQEGLISGLEGKVRTAKFGSRIRTVALAAVAGYLVYSTIKK